MSDFLLAQAARNNAEWCNAISSVHAGPGTFEPSFWMRRGEVPPYTSNLVTLAGAEATDSQLIAIRSLRNGGAKLPFSIKDAFNCLELASLGFTKLFEATWIIAHADAPLPADPAERVRWSLVTQPAQLACWERAWRGSSTNEALRDDTRVFPDRLLEVPALRFMLGSLGGVPAACAALNRTGDVVGLSNVFSSRQAVGPLYPGALRIARRLFPGVPVVGYARGDGLAAAKRAGYGELRALTVWQSASV